MVLINTTSNINDLEKVIGKIKVLFFLKQPGSKITLISELQVFTKHFGLTTARQQYQIGS